MKKPIVASLRRNSSPSIAHKVAASPSSQPGGTRSFASSEAFGWDGLHLEAGFRRGWQVDEIMLNGHHLTMNLDDDDLCFETRDDSDWVTVRLAPLEFWINPEGRPFSVRKMADSRYASCTIDGRYLDSLAGCHFELDAGTGIGDPVLARLVQALIAIIEDKAHYSQALAAEVIRAFVNAVAARHGHPAEELKAKGGIASNPRAERSGTGVPAHRLRGVDHARCRRSAFGALHRILGDHVVPAVDGLMNDGGQQILTY
jgi:hypothetical protein